LGQGQTGREEHILQSSDSSFDLFIDTAGHVNAKLGKASAVTVTDTNTLSESTWRYIAVLFDGTNLSLYSQGQLDRFTQAQAVGTKPAAYSGATAGSTLIALNSNDFQHGFVGSIDDLRIYASAQDEFAIADNWYTTNSGYNSQPTGAGQAATAANVYTFFGKFVTAQVVFSTQTAGSNAGAVTIKGQFSDILLTSDDVLVFRFYKAGGVGTANPAPWNNIAYRDAAPAPGKVLSNGQGTAWYSVDSLYGSLSFKPAVSQVLSEGGAIPPFSYTIPASDIVIANPLVANAATDSDSRWSVGVLITKAQSFREGVDKTPASAQAYQGIHWQAITITPQTL